MNEIVVRVDKRDGKKPWEADWGGYILPYSSDCKLWENCRKHIRFKPLYRKDEHFLLAYIPIADEDVDKHFGIIVKEVKDG